MNNVWKLNEVFFQYYIRNISRSLEGRGELEDARQKYESMCAYKDHMLQQLQSDKSFMEKKHEEEVVKLQNTIRKMWSNLKSLKKQLR